MAFLKRKRHSEDVGSCTPEHTKKQTRNTNHNERSEFFSQPWEYQIGERSPGPRHRPHAITISTSPRGRFSDKYIREAGGHRWKPDSRLSTLEHFRPLSYANTATTNKTSNETYLSWSFPPRSAAPFGVQHPKFMGLPDTLRTVTPARNHIQQQQDRPMVHRSSSVSNGFLQRWTTDALLGGIEAFAHRGNTRYSLDDLKEMAKRQRSSQSPETGDPHITALYGRQTQGPAGLGKHQTTVPAGQVSSLRERPHPSLTSTHKGIGTQERGDAQSRAGLQSPINIGGPSIELKLQRDDAEKEDATRPAGNHHNSFLIHTLADFRPDTELAGEPPPLQTGHASKSAECTTLRLHVFGSRRDEAGDHITPVGDAGGQVPTPVPDFSKSRSPWRKGVEPAFHSRQEAVDAGQASRDELDELVDELDELDEFDARLLQMTEPLPDPSEEWKMAGGGLTNETFGLGLESGQSELWTTGTTIIEPAHAFQYGLHKQQRGQERPYEAEWEVTAESREVDHDGRGVYHGTRSFVEEMTPGPFTGFSRPYLLY
ncbi:hypothetical protein A1O1_05241 [Capronia coronata CBS 617.96]|uniref:Uncharacterized protein n=1 Tax=Capronia coronata CBS 617.96 TaxID=1182541 RepID=W9YGB9_9EURO|nr:uncharacterized protein A1O1_05241 [Capronia coronata CBS 617.96]EXJ88311.1 hypothetical protein A1O1_05241 [Capronia coronata CBS 617.96]